MRFLWKFTAIFVASALLAGCSGTSTQSGEGDSSDASASRDERELPTSEFSEIMGGLYGGTSGEDLSDEDLEKQLEEEATKREELMAQCMADQGFEYKPVTGNYGFSFESAPESYESEIERAETEGYGYFSDREETGNEQEYIDPNAAAVEKMSESEREAFYEALYGKQVEENGEYNWETAGCSGQADHEINGERAENEVDPWAMMSEDPQWEELNTGMQTMWENAQNSPEIADLMNDWGACMADEGISFATKPDDIWEHLNKLQVEVYGEWPEDAPDDYVQPDPDPKVLKKAREEERKIAVAEVKCNEKTDLYYKQAEAMANAEDKFLEENRELVESFVAAVQQAQKDKK